MKKSKTILITGAAGMIGSETVKGMLSAGYKVIGVDKRESLYNSDDNYIHYVVDLSDQATLREIISQNSSMLQIISK